MPNKNRLYALAAASLLLISTLSAQAPSPPEGLTATGYEAHIELRWQASTDPAVSGYQIFRSEDGGQNYSLLKVLGGPNTLAIDWTGDEGASLTRHYRLKAVKNNGLTSDFSDAAQAQTQPMSDEALLDMVQQYTFRYFWDYAHPVSGMARERSNGNADIVTTGGSGFGIMALIVGAERGWISRDAALNRMVQIVSFLQFADRFHGVFPHWMNGNTGNVIPFSQYDDGADLVETAFLMQGLLAARQYFNQDTPLEKALVAIITGLWEDVEWDWFRKDGGPVLYWHWSPNYAWTMNFPLRGFFEAQIVYILAAASPTHPVPGSLYQSGWTANPNYCSTSTIYGYRYYCGGYGGGPLFFAHYSYLGFDPRYWKDACCNYFIRNRNHSLIQWEYAKSNPKNHTGYSAQCWGLTASDDPDGYAAHDIISFNDNGTVAPTAALSSMPYTPDQSLAALKYFYREQGENLWSIYGFYDAFNLDRNWFAASHLAIDQGPIVVMLENYRSRLLWDLFMQNPEIEPALLACGFQPDNTIGTSAPSSGITLTVYPNPAADGALHLSFSLERAQYLSATLTTVDGRISRTLFTNRSFAAGDNRETVRIDGLPGGVYLLRITGLGGLECVRKLVLPD